MEMEVQNNGKHARVKITGKIDEHGAAELKQKFIETNLGTCEMVVFDFEHVRHIGSAGIGKLLLFYRELAVNGGTMRVENTSKSVSDLLKIVELDSLFGVS